MKPDAPVTVTRVRAGSSDIMAAESATTAGKYAPLLRLCTGLGFDTANQEQQSGQGAGAILARRSTAPRSRRVEHSRRQCGCMEEAFARHVVKGAARRGSPRQLRPRSHSREGQRETL